MRNNDKFEYFTIGIPRGAPELAALKEEAAHFKVGLPKFLSMLLIDRHLSLHGGGGNGVWFPHGYAPTEQVRPNNPTDAISDTMEMRAVAAAAAWDDQN